jgi:hypothetical protein
MSAFWNLPWLLALAVVLLVQVVAPQAAEQCAHRGKLDAIWRTCSRDAWVT